MGFSEKLKNCRSSHDFYSALNIFWKKRNNNAQFELPINTFKNFFEQVFSPDINETQVDLNEKCPM